MATLSGTYNEEMRLSALQRYSILDSLPETGYEDVTTLASHICGTPIALVSLVDAERQWFKSELGLGVRETPRSQSFCAHTVYDAKTLIVEDASLDPRFATNPLVTDEPGIRFYAGAPIVTSEGHVLGTVCVIDTQPRVMSPAQITALEALARQVMAQLDLRLTIEINEKAAEAMRTVEKLSAVGRLASTMAHEINNPLQSMTNLLYMAESSERYEDKQSYLKQSQEELARVSHIVTQTLRFHRQSNHAAPTMLGEIVESILSLFQTRLRQASVQVAVRDRQTVPLLCYNSDLRQVLANLVGNAIDSIQTQEQGSIEIRIRDAVSPKTGANGIRMIVSDSGTGMTEATRNRLFEPFYSTKGARGTGLGLWVSKGILDKHKADIRVRSRQGSVGHGTVFSIFLPQCD